MGFKPPLSYTITVIWKLSSFTGGERPQVPHTALFQAQASTLIESLMFFVKLVRLLPHKENIQNQLRD
jgi:hypothetical protein